MSKSDYPALRMIVEGNRLVPASQFEAERLNSYRRGAVVMCRFTEEKDRVLVRKWWAVLGMAVKQCKTPWKTKEEASEAVKLALGIVNLSKTTQDKYMQYPKSLTELDDPEMQDALDQMIALMSRITGVDVDTLRKETDHVAETDTNSEDAPPSSSEPGEPSSLPEEAGASSSSPGAPASDNCADLLARYAKEILHKAADTTMSGKEIAATKERWSKDFAGFPEEITHKVEMITKEARQVFSAPAKLAEAIENVAGLIGVDADKIGGGNG